eukprot:TRINITY_DN4903_c0_g1_i1.p1 TRINITY_DN4903_c0_g1~~TRINITY_DN4903_c0_g1_i1.p1  ORF type:complete len:535 (+),score=51.75 TRINITY_DN4903_c0_g1_i1:28-1632(+)
MRYFSNGLAPLSLLLLLVILQLSYGLVIPLKIHKVDAHSYEFYSIGIILGPNIGVEFSNYVVDFSGRDNFMTKTCYNLTGIYGTRTRSSGNLPFTSRLFVNTDNSPEGEVVCDGDTCTLRKNIGKTIATQRVQDNILIPEIPWSVTAPIGIVHLSEEEEQTLKWPEDISGIVGLGYNDRRRRGGLGIDLLMDKHGFPTVYSICVLEQHLQSVMTLGEDYYEANNTQYAWTPMKADQEGLYEVSVESIKVGEVVLELNNNTWGALSLDPIQTKYLNLQQSIFDQFLTTLNSLCQNDTRLVGFCSVAAEDNIFQKGYYMNLAEVDLFPTIHFQISGHSKTESDPKYFKLSPREYLAPIPGTGTYVLSIGASADKNIIGQRVFRDYHIVFDKQRMLIGFGSYRSCRYESERFTNITLELKEMLKNRRPPDVDENEDACRIPIKELRIRVVRTLKEEGCELAPQPPYTISSWTHTKIKKCQMPHRCQGIWTLVHSCAGNNCGSQPSKLVKARAEFTCNSDALITHCGDSLLSFLGPPR